jgi:hypothetical protein
MKRPLLFLSFISLTFLSGCDKVVSPYVEGQCGTAQYIGTDTAIIKGDTLGFGPVTGPPVKKVLLEDYTGHTCGSCPPAGQFIVNTLFPDDRLVAMSVHAGNFALPNNTLPNQPPNSFQTDFRCQTSERWYSKFSVSFNPCGMVDRVGYPDGSHLLPYVAWQGAISGQKALSPDVRIRIKSDYSEAERTAYIAVQTIALRSLNRELKLQVVVTEDSVQDWQVWYGHTPEYEPNYLHRHVLRGAANGDFGATIYSGSVASGTKRINASCFELTPAMDPAQCSVVAFVFDAQTEEILQVEELHLGE